MLHLLPTSALYAAAPFRGSVTHPLCFGGMFLVLQKKAECGGMNCHERWKKRVEKNCFFFSSQKPSKRLATDMSRLKMGTHLPAHMRSIFVLALSTCAYCQQRFLHDDGNYNFVESARVRLDWRVEGLFSSSGEPHPQYHEMLHGNDTLTKRPGIPVARGPVARTQFVQN
jgi:hypothetical protein